MVSVQPIRNLDLNLEKTISDLFDEFLMIVNKNIYGVFHKSECFDQRNFKIRDRKSDDWQIINDSHAFCAFCNEHLYSYSRFEDINSFFQKHINTEYHRSSRIFNTLSDNEQMITWEDIGMTGHCNVCNISGLNAVVINTYCDVFALKEKHLCSCSTIYSTIDKLKRFCCLSLFLKKFTSKLNNRLICALCNKIISHEEPISFHFASKHHLYAFLKLIHSELKLNIMDLLNGFHLEMVLKWLLKNKVTFDNSTPSNDCGKYNCLLESNNCNNVYVNIRDYLQIIPKYISDMLNFHSDDFIIDNACLLCNEQKIENAHIYQQTHLKNLKNANNVIINSKNYTKCLEKVGKRLQPYKIDIVNYYTYKNLLAAIYSERNEKVKDSTIKSNSSCSFCGKQEPKTHLVENKCEACAKKNLPDSKEKEKNLMHQSHAIEEKKVVKQSSVTRKDISLEQKNKTKNEKKNKSEIKSSINKKKNFKQMSDQKNKSNKVEALKEVDNELKNKTVKNWKRNKKKNLTKESEGSKGFDANVKNVVLECSVESNGDEMRFKTGHQPKNSGFNNFLQQTKNDIKLKKVEKSGSEGDPLNVTPAKNVKTEKTQPFTKSNDFDGVQDSVNSAFMKSLRDHHKKQLDNLTDFEIPLKIEKCNENVLYTDETKKKSKSGLKSPAAMGNKFVYENSTHNIGTDKSNTTKPNALKNDPETNKGSNKAKGKHRKRKKNNRETVVIDLSHKDCGVGVTDNAAKNTEKSDKTNPLKASVSQNGKPSDSDQIAAPIKQEAGSGKKNKKKASKSTVFDSDEEVLMIKYLPPEWRDNVKLYNVFRNMGKIKEVIIVHSRGFIVFEKPESIVCCSSVTFNGCHFEVMKTVRKETFNKEKTMHPVCVTYLKNSNILMDRFTKFLRQYLAPWYQESEILREQMLCRKIIDAVKKKYPKSRCYPFGSKVTGLSLDSSDLDVFLDCGDAYEGSSQHGRKLTKDIYKLLLKKDCFSRFTVVANARVPIISFFEVETQLKCDLSFTNALGVQNSAMLRFMLLLDKRIRPLMLAIKEWVILNELHGRPNFSSYALALMTIFYLQQLPSPILPAIETLQKNYSGRRYTINGWDCNISDDVSQLPKVTNGDSVPELLMGFFEYYRSFDYKNHIISPLTGQFLLKETFINDFTSLPMAYKRHFHNMSFPIKEEKSCIWCVDPFNLSHNVTGQFPENNFKTFLNFCNLSVKYLNEGL